MTDPDGRFDSDRPCPRCGREYHVGASGFIHGPVTIEFGGPAGYDDFESECVLPATDDDPAAAFFHQPHHGPIDGIPITTTRDGGDD